MDLDYFKTVITVALAVLGWIIAHFFTNKRAISSRRRELVTEYLIEAYRILTTEITHRDFQNEKLENVISIIQLFGSLNQVEMAKMLADDVASGNMYELDPLINSLRNDLRKELKLSEIQGNVKWLRFER